MSGPIKSSDGAHWYEASGQPRYEADLRTARKEGLFVSPTTLESKQWKNPFLDMWKINQLAIAAYENPRQAHDELDTYCKRIHEISMEKASNAASFGTKIHDAIEKYPTPPSFDVAPWYDKYGIWHESRIQSTIATESVVADRRIGVAGKVDRRVILIDGMRAIIDYKTQDVKVDDKGRKKPAFYPAFGRQLSFYAVADAIECGMYPSLPVCISLVIDSNENGDVYEKEYEDSYIRDCYINFVTMSWLWFRGGNERKPFWPVGEWQPNEILKDI